jgi:branched-subunit amino acid aminotransferase/4-amino-4-deoxychorismate lyase
MINFNGSLFDDNERILAAQNRAFRYGDGLFESIRVFKGKMPFYNYHFERILRGMKALKMNIPSYFNPHYIKNEISKTLENQPNSRVRLAVYREDGGFYAPSNHNIDFLIETTTLPESKYLLNDLGLTIGVFRDYTLRQTAYSAFKTSNSLPYVMAGIFAKENSFEDVLLLNTDLSRDNREGYIAEGISSNIFIVKENKLITPSLSSGCVGGIMRQIIFEIAQEQEITCSESNITIQDMAEADEVFYTNAMQGIRWVENFESKTYQNEMAQKLYELLLLRLK